MNLRGFILGTVAANLALVGALLWQASRMPAVTQRDTRKVTTNVVMEVISDSSARPVASSVPGSPPFHWNQMEDTNHLQFLTNLLAIGCPPETALDILDARVADEFRVRLRELARPVQPRFWEGVAAGREADELLKEPELEKQIAALKEERKRVQAELETVVGRETKAGKPGRNEHAGHLSVEKHSELAELDGRHTKERDTLNRDAAKAPAAERATKQKELRERQHAERRAIFTDAEWSESELRRSPFAARVRELRGYAASPDEMKSLARQLGDFENSHPIPAPRDPKRPADDPDLKAKQDEREAQRKAFFTARLGAAGFAVFERGSDPRFHTLLKLARRLELPAEAAAQWLEIQTASQEQARQTKQSAELTGDLRALALLAIRAETERTLQATVGARGWGAYQRHSGDWLKQLEK